MATWERLLFNILQEISSSIYFQITLNGPSYLGANFQLLLLVVANIASISHLEGMRDHLLLKAQ